MVNMKEIEDEEAIEGMEDEDEVVGIEGIEGAESEVEKVEEEKEISKEELEEIRRKELRQKEEREWKNKRRAEKEGEDLEQRLLRLEVVDSWFTDLKNEMLEDGNEEAYQLMGEYEKGYGSESYKREFSRRIRKSVEEHIIKKSKETFEKDKVKLKENDKLPELEYSEIEKEIVDTYGKNVIASAVRGSKLSSLNMDFELIGYEVVSTSGKNNAEFMVHLYPAKGLEADVTIAITLLETVEVNSEDNIVKWVGKEDKSTIDTKEVTIFGNFIENFERSGEKVIKGKGYTAISRAARYYVEGIVEVSKREKKAKEEEQQQLLAKEQASIQKAKEERAEKEKVLKRQKDLEKIGVKPIDTKEGMQRIQRFEGLLKKNQESLKIQYKLVQDKVYGSVILVNIGIAEAPLRLSPNFIMNGLTDEILYITSGKQSIRSGYNRVLRDYGIGLSKIKQRRYISKIFMMFEQANDLRRKV